MKKKRLSLWLAGYAQKTLGIFVACVFISVFGISGAAHGNEIAQRGSVLVAHDSKHGTTEDIAELIGDILREIGFQVDVLTAHKIDDISGYDAIVLGSPIYYNLLLPGVMQFLKKHELLLAQKKVAVFASGTAVDPETGQVREHVRGIVVRELNKFPAVEPIGTIGLLPGKFFLKEVFPVEFIGLKMLFGEAGDLTDDAIVRQWAEEIALLL